MTINLSSSFLLVLTLVFTVLKLTAVIDWSWLLILLPLWGPFAAVFGVLIAILLILLIVAVLALIFIGVAEVFDRWV